MPGKEQNPPCQFAMCGPQRNLRAPLFFPSPFSFFFFFVLFYDAGFPEHPAWPPQLLESKRRRRTLTHDGEGAVSLFVHVANRPGCKV